MINVVACLTLYHDPRLVALAAFVCILSSVMAFAMLGRAEFATGRRRAIWAVLGATVTANGIWSTHYISMLAYDVGLPTSFAFAETLASAIIIEAACLTAFMLYLGAQSVVIRSASGAVLGAGIAAMHYVGMQGLRVSAVTIWDPQLVAASIVMGIALATAALNLFHFYRHRRLRFAAPLLLVAGICALHFTAMGALTLAPFDINDVTDAGVSHTFLAVVIGAFSGLIIIAMIAGVFLDRYFEERERYAAYLEELVKQLRKREQEALAANEAKSEFVATISHELRTPLNGILGMLRLLQDSELSGEQRKQASTASESAKGLLKIINDILDHSKLREGKMALEETTFSACQLIDEVLSLMSIRAADKGLSISVDFDPDVPEWLSGDSGRLRQILYNLVGNAIKFTDQGGVVISVSHHDQADGGVDLSVAVKDTGIGIEPHAQKKLFSRFAQADASIARRFGGAGLGLAISKQLAVLMDGDIRLQSEPGLGSTFTATIPFQRASRPALETAPVATPQPSRPLRVLIVDDNHVNQYFVCELLRKQGHACEHASDGIEALDAWRERSFDLILMDIHMPRLDGLAATRLIREAGGRKSAIPIIALTANAMPGDGDVYLKAGMNGYVAKPIEPAVLQSAIACAVEDAAPASAQDCTDAAGPAGDARLSAAMRAPLFEPDKLASLLDLFGDSESQKMIDETLDESARLLRKIEAALSADDLTAARRTAHSLKGMASNWAAERIEEVARHIEAEVNTIAQAKAAAEGLDRAIAGARDWIEERRAA